MFWSISFSGFVLQQPEHVILGNDLLQLFPRITSCFPGSFDGDCKYSMHILIIYHYTIPKTSTKNLYTKKTLNVHPFSPTFRKFFQNRKKVMNKYLCEPGLSYCMITRSQLQRLQMTRWHCVVQPGLGTGETRTVSFRRLGGSHLGPFFLFYISENRDSSQKHMF